MGMRLRLLYIEIAGSGRVFRRIAIQETPEELFTHDPHNQNTEIIIHLEYESIRYHICTAEQSLTLKFPE